MCVIQVEGLHHVYREGTPFAAPALFDINLTVQENEFLGITGPTQGGKSTLIQYFNGLFRPQKKGQVRVLGQDMAGSSLSIQTIRQQVGLVFQTPEHQLFKETVGEDIGFWPVNLGWEKERIDQGVKEAMERVGLDYDTFYHRDIFSLSGGEKRRVAIAGVLIVKPAILILDNPISGLDPRGQRQILALTKKLHLSGMVIIFVSSSSEELLSLVDRLLILDRGRILFTGTPEAFLTQEEEDYIHRLGLPLGFRLKRALKERGVPFHTSPFSLEQIEEELDRILGGA